MNQSFFKDVISQDILNDPTSSSEAIFDSFNDCCSDPHTIKDRDNYVKSLFKVVGFRKEIAVDNLVLSTFFASNESATARSQGYYDDEDEEKLVEIRFIIHNLLPDFERDIMTLIFDYNKIQEDIGVILGLSQEMVNYYKKRAVHRILHFYEHRKIDVNDMRCCLSQYMSKRQLEAMMLYFFKHNQRIVSKELGISQSAVSARLKQGLKKIRKKSKLDENVMKYYKIFDNLSKQKSLYNSQTRMKVITDVDNYVQFDEDNQRIMTPIKHVIENDKKLVEKKIVKKSRKIYKLSLPANKSLQTKKVKRVLFNRLKLKKLRNFFKR